MIADTFVDPFAHVTIRENENYLDLQEIKS
jgi:hypothetical protein